MAGTPGNTNSADGKRYRKALERALAHEAGSVEDGLFKLAKVRLAKALDGDSDAGKEIADRFDGRPAQVVAGDPDAPLETVFRWAVQQK